MPKAHGSSLSDDALKPFPTLAYLFFYFFLFISFLHLLGGDSSIGIRINFGASNVGFVLHNKQMSAFTQRGNAKDC